MNAADQQTHKELSPGLIAVAESSIGIVLVLMTLRSELSAQNLTALPILALGFCVVVWLYVACRAILSETPEWTKNAKRLNGIGGTVMFAGFPVGEITGSSVLSVIVIVAGMIMTLISTLHPSSRIRKIASIGEEDGVENAI